MWRIQSGRMMKTLTISMHHSVNTQNWFKTLIWLQLSISRLHWHLYVVHLHFGEYCWKHWHSLLENFLQPRAYHCHINLQRSRRIRRKTLSIVCLFVSSQPAKQQQHVVLIGKYFLCKRRTQFISSIAWKVNPLNVKSCCEHLLKLLRVFLIQILTNFKTNLFKSPELSCCESCRWI